MTAPPPPGGPSPLRVGGIALIGVGVIAGIIGLAAPALDGGDGPPVAAPPTSSSGTGAPSTGVDPGTGRAPDATAPGGGVVPIPSFGPTPTPTPNPTNGLAGPGAGGTGSGGSAGNGSGGSVGDGSGSGPDAAGGGSAFSGGSGGGGGGGGGQSIVRGPVRVYNNSTITGLAARAAADFRQEGWQVEEVGNYPSGIIPTSTVYYRPGTSEQPAARVMGDGFGLRVEPRFDGLDAASPGLIVIVTNDYRGR